jgi:endo-1,4-beta-xylanase
LAGRSVATLAALVLPAQAPAAQAPAKPQAEAQWLDPDRTAPAGTRYRTFHSRAAGGEVSYLIYLPPDYESARDRRYPVVYWLHGLGGNQRGGATFVSQFDAAVRTGKVPPALVVLVNGLRDSRYYDSYDGRRPVETVIIQDLVPHVDQIYRSVARRESRAIGGYSMGGFGAARLGFKYPELFGAVSIMAGALLDTDSVATSMHPELFPKNFGSDKAYFHAGSPWVLAYESAGRIRGRTHVRIGVGELDALYERNLSYHEMLGRLGIAGEFFSVPGVAHNQREFYQKAGVGDFYRRVFP